MILLGDVVKRLWIELEEGIILKKEVCEAVKETITSSELSISESKKHELIRNRIPNDLRRLDIISLKHNYDWWPEATAFTSLVGRYALDILKEEIEISSLKFGARLFTYSVEKGETLCCELMRLLRDYSPLNALEIFNLKYPKYKQFTKRKDISKILKKKLMLLGIADQFK